MRQDPAAVCLSVSSSSPPPLPHLADEKSWTMAQLSLLHHKLDGEEVEEEDRVRLVLSRSSGASASFSAALETTDGRWGARRCTE